MAQIVDQETVPTTTTTTTTATTTITTAITTTTMTTTTTTTPLTSVTTTTTTTTKLTELEVTKATIATVSAATTTTTTTETLTPTDIIATTTCPKTTCTSSYPTLSSPSTSIGKEQVPRKEAMDDEYPKPNPLLDIEKFIQEGVNLLNSDYRLDEKPEPKAPEKLSPLSPEEEEEEYNDGNDEQEPDPSSHPYSAPYGPQEENAMEVDGQVEGEGEGEGEEPSVVTSEIGNELPETKDDSVVTPNTISKMMNEVNISDEVNPPMPSTSNDDVVMTETTAQTIQSPASPSPERLLQEENIIIPVQSDTLNCSVESPTKDPGVRRSHRIKKINKSSKAMVGRGLVRDRRERFSIKDDENRVQYSFDDHLMDLAEVDAKNAKFLKEMEERLTNFQVIKDNEFKCERVISREARKMICDCFLTVDEEERGELGCGEDCLNRMLMIECGPNCNVKDRCTNRRFQRYLYSPCRVFRTEKKGFGIMADTEIHPGEFIMEYIGEVIDSGEFERRRINYSRDKNRHYYFMALRSDMIIDATRKGNISRFINHSCDPNAETQKWTVNGELRIGFFSRKSIMPGEEITFDYQYQRYGREAQRCYCESSNCRGWIGQEPNSDEGEQQNSDSNGDDDDDEEDDDDDEEEDEDDDDEDVENAVKDARNLLEADDDFGSDSDDTIINDPATVQRKLEMAAAVELDQDLNLKEKNKYGSRSSTTTTSTTTTTTRRGKRGRRKKNLLVETSTPPTLDDSLEDSNAKLQRLLSKVAEKVAAKQLQNRDKQIQQKRRRGRKRASSVYTNGGGMMTSAAQRLLEDPDIDEEVEFLKHCGVKNQSETLRLSRLMVRAKIVATRLNLLEILRMGELPCRRLFLDYHGLRLLHGWMNEDQSNLEVRYAILQTLKTLPIVNKTMLSDSKVFQVVNQWAEKKQTPNGVVNGNRESAKEDSKGTEETNSEKMETEMPLEESNVQQLASELLMTWETLPEIFRIPKKERIEQMKEHEREADRQYAETAKEDEKVDINLVVDHRYQRDRFGRNYSNITTLTGVNRYSKNSQIHHQQQQQQQYQYLQHLPPQQQQQQQHHYQNQQQFYSHANGYKYTARSAILGGNYHRKNLTKKEYRELFAARVAREEAYKRLAEERKEFEVKCRFFGLDGKKLRPQDMPYCVDPSTGQWYNQEHRPIPTPPSYAHVQVAKRPQSTDPKDYDLPDTVNNLPPEWKYAITKEGKIYYYHVQERIPQWEPPTIEQLRSCGWIGGELDSESDVEADEMFLNMDAKDLKEYIEKRIERKRQRRAVNLVDERSISPRREEDRIYNQIEVRKYKENKEKIRKRKEELRRKRLENPQQNNNNNNNNGNETTEICSSQIGLIAVVKEYNETHVDIVDNNNSGTREKFKLRKESMFWNEERGKTPTTSPPTLIRVGEEENDKDLINALPIQDYLLSSDEDDAAEQNASCMDEEDDETTERRNENEVNMKKDEHDERKKSRLFTKDLNVDDNDDCNQETEEDDYDVKSDGNKLLANTKIVDELDAIKKRRPLKMLLKSKRGASDHSMFSSVQQVIKSNSSNPQQQQQNNDAAAAAVNKNLQNSSPYMTDKQQHMELQKEQQEQLQLLHDIKKRKLDRKDNKRDCRDKERKVKDDKDMKYRKLREKFRCDIAGLIVHHLKPYRKDTCKNGRIQSIEDFNHLARKLTHFVMIKELRYCESVGQTLVVTESVKSKSREFIKKYMAKYDEVYQKPDTDPEFKEIPFTL